MSGPTRTLLSVPSAAPSAFSFEAGSTALLMIDWQKDFLDVGGFGHSLGAAIAMIAAYELEVEEGIPVAG